MHWSHTLGKRGSERKIPMQHCIPLVLTRARAHTHELPRHKGYRGILTSATAVGGMTSPVFWKIRSSTYARLFLQASSSCTLSFRKTAHRSAHLKHSTPHRLCKHLGSLVQCSQLLALPLQFHFPFRSSCMHSCTHIVSESNTHIVAKPSHRCEDKKGPFEREA